MSAEILGSGGVNDRNVVLGRLPAPADVACDIEAQAPIAQTSIETLWNRFGLELSKLGGELMEEERLDFLSGQSVFCESETEEWTLQRGGNQSKDVWSADIGVICGACAIAETGSVLVSTSTSPNRLASLAPPTNLVLIRETNIVLTLAEALDKHLSDENSVVITGPSRTADIEGVLVRGIHGPQHFVVIRCR